MRRPRLVRGRRTGPTTGRTQQARERHRRKEAARIWRENCITFRRGTLITPHSGMKLHP